MKFTHRKLPRARDIAATFITICITSVCLYSVVFTFFLSSRTAQSNAGRASLDSLQGNVDPLRFVRGARLGRQPELSPQSQRRREQLRHALQAPVPAAAAEGSMRSGSGQQSGRGPVEGSWRVREARKSFNRNVKQYHAPRQRISALAAAEAPAGQGGTHRGRCSNCTFFPTPLVPESVRAICGDPSEERPLELVVLVVSDVGSFEERQALRETWLRPRAKVRHLFLVGRTTNATLNARLAVEATSYRDLLEGRFLESRQHHTHKTLMGLHWVSRFCRHALHVLKVRPDAWVNVPSLLTYLQANPLQGGSVGLAGYCQENAVPERNPRAPSFVSLREFDDLQYPPFCNGSGYVTTPAVAEKVVGESRNVPLFVLEDVYLGFCLRSLRLRVQHVAGFSLGPGDTAWVTRVCQLHDRRLLLRHDFTPAELRAVWAEGACVKPKRRLKIGLPLPVGERQVHPHRQRQRHRQRRRLYNS